jgi:hypothetical protein
MVKQMLQDVVPHAVGQSSAIDGQSNLCHLADETETRYAGWELNTNLS